MSAVLPAKIQQLKKQALRQRHLPGPWFELATVCGAQGLIEEAAEAYEQLGKLQPQNWQVWFFLANQQYALGRYPQALDHYLKAMQLNQGSWEVRNNLAVLLKLLGERQLAEKCLLEALDLKPDYLEAIANLGNLYRDQQQFDKAHLCFDTALEIKPDSAELLTNLGLLHKEQGQLDEAIAVYRRAVAQPSYPPELPYNYAIALIQSGDFRQGFAWYEKRWLIPRLNARRQLFDAVLREWQGEFLGGKTLLVWNEQGLGDMIQMARYLPLWKAHYHDCRIILCVDPSLVRLFAGLPGADSVVGMNQALPQADYHLSAMSFPFRLHTEIETIPHPEPYLRANDALRAVWAERLGPKGDRPRVGIVWQSGQSGVGQQALDRQSRSLAPDVLAQLLRLCPVEWINLQVGEDEIPAEVSGLMRHLPQAIGDFADSAAILSSLDALVSVDTAASHLGAALGIPTWVLMRATGGNLFPAEGECMPWYRAMTVLRQRTLYDWQPVIAEVAERLHGLA